jgi:hypothetical protein
MSLYKKLFVKKLCPNALFSVVLSLLITGCASQPPPPAPYQYLPPATQVVVPSTGLTSDQMAQLSKASPDTARRVQTAEPLNLDDVKVMAKLGFSSDVIMNQVRNSRTVFHLTANAIIDLKNSGVSESLIDFLISTPSSIGGSAPVPEPATNLSAAQTPPPPPPDETQPPTPGPDYVWAGGDWVWNGGWVWVGGHWVLPPYPGAIWFHGGWRRGWGGYYHGRGRWYR